MDNSLHSIISKSVNDAKAEYLESDQDDHWESFDNKFLNNGESWTKQDFYAYFLNKFKEKYNEPYALGIKIFYMELGRLSDSFKNKFKYRIKKTELKLYINWFMDKKITDYRRKFGNDIFYLAWIRWPETLSSYSDYLKMAGICNEEEINKKPIIVPELTSSKKASLKGKAQKDPNFNSDFMRTIFEDGRNRLIIDYGVVISFGWMVNSLNMTERTAKDIIVGIIKDILKKSKSSIDTLVYNTNAYDPYPIWCKFDELDNLIDNIKILNPKLKSINVRFSKYCKCFGFLQKGV